MIFMLLEMVKVNKTVNTKQLSKRVVRPKPNPITPHAGDYWRLKGGTLQYLVLTVKENKVVLAHGVETVEWKETIHLQKFLQQYELVHRGKNLVTERKIKLVNCTFHEWYSSNEDILWIQHWNGSLCYADGLKNLKGKDLQHWEVYKANYLHFGKPNYQLDGTNNNGTTQLRWINKWIIMINYNYFN